MSYFIYFHLLFYVQLSEDLINPLTPLLPCQVEVLINVLELDQFSMELDCWNWRFLSYFIYFHLLFSPHASITRSEALLIISISASDIKVSFHFCNFLFWSKSTLWDSFPDYLNYLILFIVVLSRSKHVYIITLILVLK